MRPVAVAITGGIGAGKSEALRSFAAHGAATVSSDEIVHHLLRADPDVKRLMVKRFGESILDADGNVDRTRVARVVFANRDALDFLERLLHPKVSAEYLRWREQLGLLEDPPKVCVTEVPLLYEAGSEANFDKVVVVTAPRKLREQRRHGLADDDRETRLIPDAEKAKRADYVYVNTGSIEDLDEWVGRVMEELART